MTRDKLCLVIVNKICKYYRGRKYLVVNIESLLRVVFESDIDTDKMENINKRAFWRTIMEALVNEIIRCISHSYEKSKKDLLRDTITKLYADTDIFTKEFEDLVGPSTFKAEREKIFKVLLVL